jgi:hypothetical protein
LRLRGYDAYRFGGAELRDDDHAIPLLTEFFMALFARYGITDSCTTERAT